MFSKAKSSSSQLRRGNRWIRLHTVVGTDHLKVKSKWRWQPVSFVELQRGHRCAWSVHSRILPLLMNSLMVRTNSGIRVISIQPRKLRTWEGSSLSVTSILVQSWKSICSILRASEERSFSKSPIRELCENKNWKGWPYMTNWKVANHGS